MRNFRLGCFVAAVLALGFLESGARAQTVLTATRTGSVSNPAAGSQATVSVAAVAGRRHVADCLSFSAGAIVAPALTALTVNLRDGATGAGTVLMTWTVIIPAATGQAIPPVYDCGLNLMGSDNTAMTFEFSASLANLLESVSLVSFDRNSANVTAN